MNKKIFVRISLAIGIAVILGLVWFAFFRQQTHEWYVKNEIAKANYCEIASDCQMIAQSQCPFGCCIHVNKNEVERIGKLLENYARTRYRTSCEYLCVEFKGVGCVNNTCQLVQ